MFPTILAQIADIDPTTWTLKTVTGIVLITLGAVEVLKRAFRTNVGFGKIPTFCYAIVIAFVLTVLASKVVKIDGEPALNGELWQNTWRAVLAAASASGFFSWLRDPATLGNSGPTEKKP